MKKILALAFVSAFLTAFASPAAACDGMPGPWRMNIGAVSCHMDQPTGRSTLRDLDCPAGAPYTFASIKFDASCKAGGFIARSNASALPLAGRVNGDLFVGNAGSIAVTGYRIR